MVNPGKIVVFAAGPGKRSRQFRVTERTAQRDQSSDGPERHQGEVGGYGRNLESETRKDAGSDHIRHN